MNTLKLIALGIIVMLVLAGCGGGKATQHLDSPWYGALFGVETLPTNNETNVDMNTWIEVYWPHAGYPPPANFTVSLEKEVSAGNWGTVNTIMDDDSTDPDNGIWWFVPESQLSPYTYYRIIITEDGTNKQAIAYFRTGNTSSQGALSVQTTTGKYCPSGAGTPTGEAAAVHHIQTK